MLEYEDYIGNIKSPEGVSPPDPLAWTKNPKWLNIRGITHDEVFHPEKCPHGRLERIIGGIRKTNSGGSTHKGHNHQVIKPNGVTNTANSSPSSSPSLVGFGKYAGLTIKELQQKDFRYLKWIAGENPKFKKKVVEALGKDWELEETQYRV